MSKSQAESKNYLGLVPIGDYKLTEYVGSGKFGAVYKAVSESTGLVRACKVIAEGKLADGWQREVEKVRLLQGVENIVQYHGHEFAEDRQHRPLCCVLFDFIDGDNLGKLLKSPTHQLNLPFIETVLMTILKVLYACKTVSIFHGDLHAGNILIAKPDFRVLGSKKKVYISDFGYGGSQNNKQPKDDFQETANVIMAMLNRLQQDSLDARDRVLHPLVKDFVQKRVRDGGRTAGIDAGILQKELEELTHRAEREAAAGTKEGSEPKAPGDYLWAEALGYRVEEWRNLFVPKFLATSDLLAKNITVLTGARGCGKTMSFRRITRLMDIIAGPSGVVGADQFVGFYLNCRDLVDASTA